ncbi:MAG: hypothetical protein QM811_28760 [Pirellulales bacterium]
MVVGISENNGVQRKHIALYLDAAHDRNSRIGIGDIAVIHKGTLKLFIEIEECKSGSTPKTILADAIIPLLSSSVRIYRPVKPRLKDVREYSLDKAKIWVAWHTSKGNDTLRTGALQKLLDTMLNQLKPGKSKCPVEIRLFNESTQDLSKAILNAFQDEFELNSF